jgi:hypothetical protein
VIVHPDTDGIVLITQPDHAALAARLIGEWEGNGLPASPRRDAILAATLNHDNGWSEEDASPIVDADTGRVLDFMTAPDVVRQRVWPRAIESLSSEPYAAALVAQHAITVYEPNRVYDTWTPFFERMEQLRDAQLARAAPLSLRDLETDYFFVRIGDLLSLTFCCRWREPRHYGAYDVRWTGSQLMVHPDPFNGRNLEMSIPIRRISSATLRLARQDPALIVREFSRSERSHLTILASGAP